MCLYVCMYVCIYRERGCLCVCLYVCLCVHIYIEREDVALLLEGCGPFPSVSALRLFFVLHALQSDADAVQVCKL